MPIDGPVDHPGDRAGADAAESAAGRRGCGVCRGGIFPRGAHRSGAAAPAAEGAGCKAREGKSQETEEENRPKTDGRELPYRQIVLVTDIVHTEQQRRHKSQYHNRHGSFRIDTVMDMYPRTGSRRRYIQESFKPLEYRTEHRQPAAGHKVGFYLIEIIS